MKLYFLCVLSSLINYQSNRKWEAKLGGELGKHNAAFRVIRTTT